MSWLSSAIKKIKKVQPGKVIVNAAKNILPAIPVVGGIAGGVIAAIEGGKKEFQEASQGGGIVGNVNQAAQDVSALSKYGLVIAIGVGLLVLFLVMRK